MTNASTATDTATTPAANSVIYVLGVETEMSHRDVRLLWNELYAALAGHHGFGGHVAEIYAYRCVPGGVASTQPIQGVTAARNLTKVLRRFAEHHRCYIGIQTTWRAFTPMAKELEPFDHRIQIEVAPLPPKDTLEHVDLTEEDLITLPSLALDQPRVLNAVCKVVGIDIQTTYFTLGVDKWSATPSDAPVFSGTLVEVGAFVRGYATAWARARGRQRLLADEVQRLIRGKVDPR